MKMRSRSVVGGAGAAGVAGAALVGALSYQQLMPDAPRTSVTDPETEICLKTPLVFFKGAKAGCSTKAEIARWRERPVLDATGGPVGVAMAHPTDFQRSTETARTCASFSSYAKRGWYAGSTREMRREAYFTRACGAIDYLLEARSPARTFFENGALSAADVRALADGPPFKIGPARRNAPVAGDAANGVEKVKDGVWRVMSDGQVKQFQEVAHADFNGDGIGDVLLYVALGVDKGSAMTSAIGFAQKTRANASPRFTRKATAGGGRSGS